MAKQPKINIAVADDHTIMRSGLVELIKTLGDYEVIIQAGNGNAKQAHYPKCAFWISTCPN
jgi:DNA-binding NarL/FixJ family response regulator